MIRYIDAHNHLQHELLAAHLGEVIESLEQIGIQRAVVNGTTEADWDRVADFASAHSWVLPSYGLHPWHIARRTSQWRERLIEHLDERLCGVGEIGLDRWIEGYDFDDQKGVFTEQLAIAARRNLPVTIHCLKAWGALWEIVRDRPVPDRGFLLHAYGGPLEMVPGFVERGAYFSFSGAFLAEEKAERREVFRHIPADRLLVETDAPSMPLPLMHNAWPLPDSRDGNPVNQPANIVAAYRGLAEIRGIQLEVLADLAEENFSKLFGK